MSDKNFNEFINDLAQVMIKHKVNNALIVFEMNEQIRNTHVGLNGEDPFFSNLSDGIDAWLNQAANN